MASERRIERLNNLLREELAKILRREVEFPHGAIVTITRVGISSNVREAKIFISILGKNPQKILEMLGKTVYHIQHILNRSVRMRPVPRISFVLDENEIRRETVERSLAELKKKGEI